VWCRPLDKRNPAEAKLFVQWLYDQRELNKFNPRLITYEQVKVYTLFDTTGIVGFLTAGTGIVADCWCFRPGLNDGGKARALASAQHFLVGKAFETNVPTLLMRPSDDKYAEFIGHYGWKKEDKLYRLDVVDLEGKHEDHQEPDA
jgi:hypothetical protein